MINSITPHFIDSLEKIVDSSGKMMKVQINTLQTINSQMMIHYDNTDAKVKEIEKVMQKTNDEYDKVEQYFSKIDEFEKKLEGMEENYEHVNDTIGRVGNILFTAIEVKLRELEKLHKLLKQIKN